MWKKTWGADGCVYDSQAEANIADWLLLNGIEYEPHKRLPNSRKVCDFYFPHYDLWVEYDGLQEVRADEKLARKIEFYEKHKMNFLIITREHWQTALYEAIFCS